MELVNINPGVKRGLIQPYTITTYDRIFFVCHDEGADIIVWNMFMDDSDLKGWVEKTLRKYLTST